MFFFFKVVRVDKTVDISAEDFKDSIRDGLKDAFIYSFDKATQLLISDNLRMQASKSSPDVEIQLDNIRSTEKYNYDFTKKEIQLRYLVKKDGVVVSPEYSHDSLNLISDQELSNFLKQEVVDKAWMEKSPRTNTTDDNQLWIIGAVLGSLLAVLIIIWISGYVYYKWVRPRRPNRFDADTPMPRKAKEVLQVNF